MSHAAFLYNQKYNTQMQNICLPLKLYFGINGFSYHRIYKNSQYVILGNNLELIRDYLLNLDYGHIFYKESLCINDNYNKTYYAILWPDEPKSSDLEIWFKYNLWNGLTILKPSDDYIEGWCFTSKKENTSIKDFYKTHPTIFLDFVNYFSNEMQSILEDGNSSLGIFKKGFDFSFPDKREGFEQKQRNIQAFYEHITFKGFKVKSKNGLIKLTPAEISCLHLLAKSQTAKEIARKLNISHRTVETHIEHIKNKSGYRLRSDIVSLFHEQLERLIIPVT